jgi:hypothetical protein
MMEVGKETFGGEEMIDAEDEEEEGVGGNKWGKKRRSWF